VIHVVVFWVITPCSDVVGYPEDLQSEDGGSTAHITVQCHNPEYDDKKANNTLISCYCIVCY
jgi:hypothetical protein